MASAFLWGLVAASSLVVGGLIASWMTVGKRTLGLIMGFGAGVLVSAVAYELVYEAVHLAKMSGFPALGFFAGALTFFFADMLIGRMGGRREGRPTRIERPSQRDPPVYLHAGRRCADDYGDHAERHDCLDLGQSGEPVASAMDRETKGATFTWPLLWSRRQVRPDGAS